MKVKIQAVKIPIVMNSWGNTPKIPDSYAGANSLMIRGTNAL